MKRILFLFLPLLLLAAAGCNDEGTNGIDGTDELTPVVEVLDIAVGQKPCAENGGSLIVITIGDNVRETSICNPSSGEPITTEVEVTEASVEQCPGNSGGSVITMIQGGVPVGDPIVVCNDNFEFACADFDDNDGDNLFDCEDPDCAGAISANPNDLTSIVQCESVELSCVDEFDNDGDLFTDCMDTDCENGPVCLGDDDDDNDTEPPPPPPTGDDDDDNDTVPPPPPPPGDDDDTEPPPPPPGDDDDDDDTVPPPPPPGDDDDDTVPPPPPPGDDDDDTVPPPPPPSGSDGTVSITPDPFDVGQPVTITVEDADLDTDPGSAETLAPMTVTSSNGESELLNLIETGANTGVFRGTLNTTFGASAGMDDDGEFNAQNDDILTATYTDALTAGGGTAVVISDATAQIATLTIASVSPKSGSIDGGTSVEIEGTGFTDATTVTFGDVDIDANSFTVNDEGTAITVTTPAGKVVGPVDVVVTTLESTATSTGGFTYDDGTTPIITSIDPTRALISGNVGVTIRGLNFTGATRVQFGEGNDATDVEAAANGLSITAKVPPRDDAGEVKVFVTTPNGDSAGVVFTYIDRKIDSFEPEQGSIDGGTFVTIKGKGFNGVTGVDFGKGNGATDVEVSDDGLTITAITPPYTTGPLFVSILLSEEGFREAVSSFRPFTYIE